MLLDAVEPRPAQDEQEEHDRDRAGHELTVEPRRQSVPRSAPLAFEHPGRRTRWLHQREIDPGAADVDVAAIAPRATDRAPPSALESDHLSPDRIALPDNVLAQVRLELLQGEIDVSPRGEISVQRHDALHALLQAFLSRAFERERVVDDGLHVVLPEARIGDLVVPAGPKYVQCLFSRDTERLQNVDALLQYLAQSGVVQVDILLQLRE